MGRAEMSPPADADRTEWAQQVADAMQRLPARQASAVRLVYSHRLSFAEAAAWLGLPRGDVQRLVSDALRQLGVALQA